MDEITVGSIVGLGTDKYKVVEIQSKKGRVIPKALHKINLDGTLKAQLLDDKYGHWYAYTWILISGGKPIDPKERIITKIKYLENKFKERQVAKAKEKELAIATPPVSENYIYGNFDEEVLQRVRQEIRSRVQGSYEPVVSYYNNINTIWGTSS